MNEEAKEILKKGVAAWNEWRQQNQEVVPDLRGARLNGLDLRRAVLDHVDLSETNGLEDARHEGASSIGLDTLFRSKGFIPDGFLLRAGVPEDVIQYLLPLIRQKSQLEIGA